MKPFLEALPWEEGSSLAMLDRRLPEGIPFQWHHHPEYELTLTRNSRGQRFVGDHVGGYGDYDLVLVGPNLPHTWVSEGRADGGGPHDAKVIWFDPGWAVALGAALVEFRALADLAVQGTRGLAFDPRVGAEVAPMFDAFFAARAQERMVLFLQIVCVLAAARAEALASVPAGGAGAAEPRGRMDRVLVHMHEHFGRAVTLPELAGVAALSVSGLHRMFRRHTGRTISGYLIDLRVGAACAQLSGGDAPIAHVAERCGYTGLANFNRQFKAARGMTPRSYRARFRTNDGARM